MIRIPVPPSLNNVFATVKGRRIKTSAYKAWRAEAGYSILAQRPQKHDGDVIVNIQIGPRIPNADIDNRIKAVLDVLTDTRVIRGDSRVVTVTAAWNNAVKGCEVVVADIASGEAGRAAA